jgi:hypothetical protein
MQDKILFRLFNVLFLMLNCFHISSGGQANLINHWPMNNLTDVVSGSSLYGGVNYSYVSDRYCQSNSAIHFNNGYLQVPSDFVYFSGDFTITTWIYLISLQSEMIIIIDFMNVECGIYSPLSNQLNKTNFTYLTTSSPILNLNEWYFMTFVLNDTIGYIYVNGNEIATGPLDKPNNLSKTNNYIGKSGSNSISNNYSNNLIFDDIKIYQGSLTQTDIMNKYNLESNYGKF